MVKYVIYFETFTYDFLLKMAYYIIKSHMQPCKVFYGVLIVLNHASE